MIAGKLIANKCSISLLYFLFITRMHGLQQNISIRLSDGGSHCLWTTGNNLDMGGTRKLLLFNGDDKL